MQLRSRDLEAQAGLGAGALLCLFSFMEFYWGEKKPYLCGLLTWILQDHRTMPVKGGPRGLQPQTGRQVPGLQAWPCHGPGVM